MFGREVKSFPFSKLTILVTLAASVATPARSEAAQAGDHPCTAR